MAFASTGSPIGGITFPVIMTNLLHNPSLGFAWGQRVCGFLSLFLLAIASVAIRPTPIRGQGKFILLEAFLKPAYSLQVAALFMVVLGIWTPYFYIAKYGLAHGMAPSVASYLFALLKGGFIRGARALRHCCPACRSIQPHHLRVFSLCHFVIFLAQDLHACGTDCTVASVWSDKRYCHRFDDIDCRTHCRSSKQGMSEILSRGDSLFSSI